MRETAEGRRNGVIAIRRKLTSKQGANNITNANEARKPCAISLTRPNESRQSEADRTTETRQRRKEAGFGTNQRAGEQQANRN